MKNRNFVYIPESWETIKYTNIAVGSKCPEQGCENLVQSGCAGRCETCYWELAYSSTFEKMEEFEDERNWYRSIVLLEHLILPELEKIFKVQIRCPECRCLYRVGYKCYYCDTYSVQEA